MISFGREYTKYMRLILQSLSLVILAFWWIFFILWQPGFIRFVQNLTYRYTSPQLTSDVIEAATSRAMEYATRGGNLTGDIYFTAAEVAHLQDVSRLYQPIRLGLGISAVAAATYVIVEMYTKKMRHDSFVWAFRILSSLGVLAAVSLIFFVTFFLGFHEVLFPQGNWMFAADSMLIRLFPEIFWRLMLGSILIMLTSFTLIYWLAAKNTHE